jgi:hypothetical protein
VSGDDSFGRTKHLSDAVGGALFGMAYDGAGKGQLRMHPGKGATNLDLGMDRLRHYAADLGVPADGIEAIEAKAREQFAKGSRLCESPIERSMLAALVTGYWRGFNALPPTVHDGSKDSSETLQPGELIIVPQMAFVKFRLDFGIVAERDGRRQIVAVECDGAAFHGDAAKEQFRVNYLKSWNVPVFKFSGKLLHEDAIAAADVVINAMSQWRAEAA